MHKILIVDDDPKNLKATQSFLRQKGFDVVTTSSPSDSVSKVQNEEFALVLVDYQMPDMMGDALTTMIHKVNPSQQVAMYSCDISREAVKNSWRAGTVEFIEKATPPADFARLIESYCNRYETICRTIRPNRDKSENRKVIESVKMTGQSPAMAKVAEIIRKLAASSDTSVLIRGESGTGKELVARALHDLSPRASGPFVAINCGAIPHNLLESELFGHLKGSFTGAASSKVGKFALANGGTLFLDEIGELPLDLQVKLLRALQERVIEPVGATSPQKINVRIITATHRNLEEMVAKKQFREDLLYRIRVAECEVPPLRSRVEDIEPLIEKFTTDYNKKHDTKKYFQRRTLDVLKQYPWPGNVRELQSMIERHFILSNESAIRPEDLEPKLYETSIPITSGLTLAGYRRRRAEDDLRFYESVLEECGGSKAAAARRLNISANHMQHLINAARAGCNNEKASTSK